MKYTPFSQRVLNSLSDISYRYPQLIVGICKNYNPKRVHWVDSSRLKEDIASKTLKFFYQNTENLPDSPLNKRVNAYRVMVLASEQLISERLAHQYYWEQELKEQQRSAIQLQKKTEAALQEAYRDHLVIEERKDEEAHSKRPSLEETQKSLCNKLGIPLTSDRYQIEEAIYEKFATYKKFATPELLQDELIEFQELINAYNLQALRAEKQIINIDLPEFNDLNAHYHPDQDTHQGAITSGSALSINRLNERYGDLDVNSELKEVEAAIQRHPDASVRESASRRLDFIKSAPGNRFGFSASQILGLTFHGASDTNATMDGKPATPEEIRARQKLVVEHLAMAETEYNGRPACFVGTVNQVLASMDGIHSDVDLFGRFNHVNDEATPEQQQAAFQEALRDLPNTIKTTFEQYSGDKTALTESWNDEENPVFKEFMGQVKTNISSSAAGKMMDQNRISEFDEAIKYSPVPTFPTATASNDQQDTVSTAPVDSASPAPTPAKTSSSDQQDTVSTAVVDSVSPTPSPTPTSSSSQGERDLFLKSVTCKNGEEVDQAVTQFESGEQEKDSSKADQSPTLGMS